jgi:hypothetical protein
VRRSDAGRPRGPWHAVRTDWPGSDNSRRRGPVITTISGQPVKQRDIDAHAWIQATIAAGVPADYRDMLALPTETVASDHYSRPTDDVEHVTGVPATNFADFVRRTDQQFEAVHQ